MQSCLCTAQVRCDVVSFYYDSCTLHTTSQVKISVCMQGSREYCPVCARAPELFVRVATAVQYSTKCCVMSRGTSTGLLGTFQASNIGEWYTKRLFRSISIILATLIIWWEFPLNYTSILCFFYFFTFYFINFLLHCLHSARCTVERVARGCLLFRSAMCNARFTLADLTPRLCANTVGWANVNGFPTRNRMSGAHWEVVGQY